MLRSLFQLLPIALLLTGPRAFAAGTNAAPEPASIALSLVLRADAAIDGRGVFLAQLAEASDHRPLPSLRLLPAPALGTSLTLTRTRLQQLLAQPEFGLVVTNWTGAAATLVSRRMRALEEAELLPMLTQALQERCVRDRGELEIRPSRPWTAAQVPDEVLTLRVLDLPASGPAPLMMVRFELFAGPESAGTWQAVLQAKVWREIWVARAALRRGQGITDADLGRERRDVLPLRELLADPALATAALQVVENVSAGAPLLQRQLRLQPVVFRGQSANAVLADGLLNLTMKVEVLEDGAPGQIVRLRNPASRRELRGKVQNEKSIVVLM